MDMCEGMKTEMPKESGDSKIANGVKLHLGCGTNILDGYINIDKSPRPGIDINLVKDILDLGFEENTIDEIRSHHLFEHFHRYEAVALIATWNRWLRPKGHLVIETPNFKACCRTYLGLWSVVGIKRFLRSMVKYRSIRKARQTLVEDKWIVLRHLYGSKEAPWANHLEGWDSYTLGTLFRTFGFNVTQIHESSGPLASVTIVGQKKRHITGSESEFSGLAERFLRRMALNDVELSIWLEKALMTFKRLRSNPLINISVYTSNTDGKG